MASICMCDADFGEDAGSSNTTFSPPVSEQRYQTAISLTKEFHPRKVIDMGCGQCSMIRLLKWHHCIEELIGVDVDAGLLKSHARLGEPVLGDYLHPRENPFVVRLYQGSISQVDDRMMDSNLLICIEVIEHLYDDDLRKVPAVIFGSLKPERALFTTPNSDFNVLFQNKTDVFRHPDHKFEWSRQQFRDWCSSICDCYPYSVQYLGIGAGPDGTEEYGCCTQAAIFTLQERTLAQQDSPQKDEGSISEEGGNHPYTLISEIIHPLKEKLDVPLKKQIEWQLESCIQDILSFHAEDIESHDDSDGRVYKITLDKLIQNSVLIKICSGDKDLLRRMVLTNEKFKLSKDQVYLLYREDEATFSDEESSNSSSDEGHYTRKNQHEEEEANWDAG